MPKVIVIIIAHNLQKYVDCCFLELLMQAFKNFGMFFDGIRSYNFCWFYLSLVIGSRFAAEKKPLIQAND